MQFVLLLVSLAFAGELQLSSALPFPPPSEYDEYSCPRRCSEDYYPLCALNHLGETKIFVNHCYLAMDNCNQSPKKIFRQTDNSKCPDYHEWISDDVSEKVK